MEQKLIKIIREEYFTRTTIGKLYFPDDTEPFCLTLEDTVRAVNIKVPGETAIPEGIYNVTVTMSSRFKRDMPMLSNQDNGYEIISKGIGFKGVRLHGGNNHNNTHGCPLLAYNRIDKTTIQGTAEKEVTSKIKAYLDAGYEVAIEIINLPQSC
jgi:hypothetical protein